MVSVLVADLLLALAQSYHSGNTTSLPAVVSSLLRHILVPRISHDVMITLGCGWVNVSFRKKRLSYLLRGCQYCPVRGS